MSYGKNYSQISHGEEDEIYPVGLGNRTRPMCENPVNPTFTE